MLHAAELNLKKFLIILKCFRDILYDPFSG